MRFSLTQAFIAIEWTSSGSFICSMMGKPWVIGWILKPKEIFLRCFGQWQIFSQILKRLCTTVIQSAQNGCLIAHWAVLKSKLELAKFADQPMKGSRKPLFCKVHWHANSVVDIFTYNNSNSNLLSSSFLDVLDVANMYCSSVGIALPSVFGESTMEVDRCYCPSLQFSQGLKWGLDSRIGDNNGRAR